MKVHFLFPEISGLETSEYNLTRAIFVFQTSY